MSEIESIASVRDYCEAWWNGRIAEAVGSLKFSCFEEVSDCDMAGKQDDLAEKMREAVNGKIVARSARKLGKIVDGLNMIIECPKQDAVIETVLTGGPGVVTSRVWSNSKEISADLLQKIIAVIPRKVVEDDDTIVSFAFWRYSPSRGPVSTMRDLACPSWDEMRENYPHNVQDKIDDLFALNKPDEVGKIILWHGPPGTGKTHLVRALAREWAAKGSTVEFVLDYQDMFNNADYMYSVLLEESQGLNVARRALRRKNGNGGRSVGHPVFEIDTAEEPDQPLRLIIIEDGADLFSVNCRHKAGFARFLNLSDGILGQGLRTVFLLTANEAIDKIDAAVHRSGRCLQELHFPALDADQANEWLADKGIEETVKEDTVLADLYAKTAGRKAIGVSAPARIGF